MLKPKPKWLQRVTPSGTWVTLAPHIYYPTYITKPELYPDIIAHEEVHVRQQTAMGLKKWLSRYLVDKEFRMHQECEAAAAQVIEGTDDEEYIIKMFQSMLNTSTYFFCDASPESVKETIKHYVGLYHTVAENPVIKKQKKLDALWAATSWYTPTWTKNTYPLATWESKYKTTPSSRSLYEDVYEDLYPVLQKDGTTGYYSHSELSNNQNRRTDEDGQDANGKTDKYSWYQDPILMENYLDRY